MKFYSLSGATFYDCINTIDQFIKPFLDNKMSIFEDYGAFNLDPDLTRIYSGTATNNHLSTIDISPTDTVLMFYYKSNPSHHENMPI